MEKNEKNGYPRQITIRVRTYGPERRPEDFKTGSFVQIGTAETGVSIVYGTALKTGRREIQSLKFSKAVFDRESAEAWTWRNYARIKLWEAQLNDEPVPEELRI
jgi:hypothetical protein